MALTYKQHDTAPSPVWDLKDESTGSAVAIDLTTATSVTFNMRTAGTTGAPKVSQTLTIVTAASGRVQHDWGSTDLDTVGSFEYEFEILWADGTKETVPNDGYGTITVVDDLDD